MFIASRLIGYAITSSLASGCQPCSVMGFISIFSCSEGELKKFMIGQFSSYSINGKCVLMGSHLKVVLDWVAFVLNAPEDLDLHLILVYGCYDGSFLFFC